VTKGVVNFSWEVECAFCPRKETSYGTRYYKLLRGFGWRRKNLGFWLCPSCAAIPSIASGKVFAMSRRYPLVRETLPPRPSGAYLKLSCDDCAATRVHSFYACFCGHLVCPACKPKHRRCKGEVDTARLDQV